jgi:hypothetical protein
VEVFLKIPETIGCRQIIDPENSDQRQKIFYTGRPAPSNGAQMHHNPHSGEPLPQ